MGGDSFQKAKPVNDPTIHNFSHTAVLVPYLLLAPSNMAREVSVYQPANETFLMLATFTYSVHHVMLGDLLDNLVNSIAARLKEFRGLSE